MWVTLSCKELTICSTVDISLNQNGPHVTLLKMEFEIQLIISYGNIITRFHWAYICIFVFLSQIWFVCQIHDLLSFVFHWKILFVFCIGWWPELMHIWYPITHQVRSTKARNITHNFQLLKTIYYHLSPAHSVV